MMYGDYDCHSCARAALGPGRPSAQAQSHDKFHN